MTWQLSTRVFTAPRATPAYQGPKVHTQFTRPTPAILPEGRLLETIRANRPLPAPIQYTDVQKQSLREALEEIWHYWTDALRRDGLRLSPQELDVFADEILERAIAHLRAQGIAFETSMMQFEGLTPTPVIKLLPTGSHPLNREVKRIVETEGVRQVLFAPHELLMARGIGMYNLESDNFFVDLTTLIHLAPSDTFEHELFHGKNLHLARAGIDHPYTFGGTAASDSMLPRSLCAELYGTFQMADEAPANSINVRRNLERLLSQPSVQDERLGLEIEQRTFRGLTLAIRNQAMATAALSELKKQEVVSDLLNHLDSSTEVVTLKIAIASKRNDGAYTALVQLPDYYDGMSPEEIAESAIARLKRGRETSRLIQRKLRAAQTVWERIKEAGVQSTESQKAIAILLELMADEEVAEVARPFREIIAALNRRFAEG
jgi:hypothetical protein